MKKVQIYDFSTGLSEQVANRNHPLELPNLTEEHLSLSFHDNDAEGSQRTTKLQQVPDGEKLFESENLLDIVQRSQNCSSPDDIPKVHFNHELSSEESPQVQRQSSEKILQFPPIEDFTQKSCLEVGSHKGKRKVAVEEQDFFKKFKKNVNMPKAIGRYFMEYYHLYKNTLFADQQKLFSSLSDELEQMKRWIQKSKKNAIKLKDLKHFFSKSQTPNKLFFCFNRLMMRKIITKFSRAEIIPNNQVKGKIEYLAATKVYSLRCSNPGLATRMQMR